MKFPTIEEMAQNIAENALDEWEYKGKTLRQWIDIIAEVGTDCISRQAAIEAIEFGITYARAFNKETGEVEELFEEGNDELRKAVERIKQLPPIQPEPHWIPVTERLPERSVEVLTCDSVGDIEIRSLKVSYDGMLYWESQEGECERLSDAIAWMPLPEPYKEVTE